jgi:hypothetical protein
MTTSFVFLPALLAGLLTLLPACSPSVSTVAPQKDAGSEPVDAGQVNTKVCRLDDCSNPSMGDGFGCFGPSSDGGQVCPDGWSLGGVEACSPPSFNCEIICSNTTSCVAVSDFCDAGPSCACLADAGCWEVEGIACDTQGPYTCTLAP